MNFKRVNKTAIATFAATATLAGVFACSALLSGCNVSTNSRKDMEQVIATVDITESEDFADSEISDYGNMVSEPVPIYKRDLYSYFLNVGYSYVNSGYSYESTFNMLVDSLVQTEVLTQYSAMYLMKEKAEDENADPAALISIYNAYEKDVDRYMYLLGYDGGDEYPEEVSIAWYNVVTSLNSAIDSYETQLLEEEDDKSGTATRSTPGNVDTEREDYFPTIPTGEEGKGEYYYGVYCSVYTGNEPYLLSQSGIYRDNRDDVFEDESTRATRVKAYSSFVGNLIENYLVDPEKEDVTDILNLEYIDIEFENQLKQQIIDKYEDDYNKEQEEKLLSEGNDGWYVNKVYEDLFDAQKETYKEGTGFADAMSTMSSSSFLLYAPDPAEDDVDYAENRYGFVYNILLPFSATQSAYLSEYAVSYATKDPDDALEYTPEYYNKRAQLLSEIETTDQRGAWFNGETQYAFEASEYPDLEYYKKDEMEQGWLFFEKNLTDKTRYEMLENYAGTYPYNGTATETEYGDYVLMPEKLSINKMLDEFVAYVDYVMGNNSGTTKWNENSAYVDGTEENKFDYSNLLEDPDVDSKDREIDYSKFVYATGKVNFGDDEDEAANRQHVLQNGEYIDESGKKTTGDDVSASAQYKALSAVNELQYAYTTDTSILSTYLGYSIDVGETDYIGEFEYAAQAAIREGAGTFYVCAGDYGWHIIYVTYTFDIPTEEKGGAQYDPDWENNYNKVGTFEYYFYEYVKSNDLGSVSTTRRSYISTLFNVDDVTVIKYEKRYQDLLDM